MTRTVDAIIKVRRNGGDFGRLYPVADSAPILRMNDAGEIKTSLSGQFVADASVDWLNDELQAVLLLDGVEHSLGVFLPARVEDGEDETAKSVNVEAYDGCWRVRDTRSEQLLYFASGTLYLDAVKQLLTAAGIGLIQETPSAAQLSEAREDWDIGTSYLTIINELLAEINYKPLWFSADGAAVLEPVKVPSAENIDHVLDSEKVESLLLPQISRATDVYSAPNVFLCICSNADKSDVLTATAENSNPQSPVSIPRRGRRVVQVTKLNNIEGQDALQEYADRLRDASMYIGETVQVSTALLPGYGVDDVTALHYGDFAAICKESAWTMELRPGGAMHHTLERVVYNLE